MFPKYLPNEWSVRRYWFILTVVAAFLLAAHPNLFALTPATEVVVKTGDPAPDGDGVFDGGAGIVVTAPALNDCGSAAFRGLLKNTTVGRQYGLFLGNGTTLGQVARTTDHAPGGASGDSYQGFSKPAVNDAGQLLFISEVTNNTTSDCLFRSQVLKRLFNWGQTAPGGNGSVFLAAGGVYNQAAPFNQKGVGAFVATLTNTTGGTTDDSAIYRTAGKLIEIVREGKNVPEGNGRFGQMLPATIIHPVMNESGQVAFRAALTNTSGGFNDNQGIYRGDGNTLTVIARSGPTQTLPGGGTLHGFGSNSSPDMNDSGEVVFAADLNGDSSDEGIFKGFGGALTKIARQGDTIPNSSDTFLVFDGFARINNAGQVAFDAEVNHTNPNSHYWALFRGNGTSTQTIVKEGQSTPVRSGIFSDLNDSAFCLNASGQVAFTAGLDVDLSNNIPVEEHGIFFFDGTQVLQVARTNDSFLGSTITTLELAGTELASNGYGVAPAERSGLNDAGQVAFRFILTDGTQGIAIWSPTLKLLCASSRKSQGGKNFDVDLPLTGKFGVECRSGGAQGNFTLVLRFTNKVNSVGSASVTTGVGSVSGTPTINGNTMTVNLTGVANAQKIVVTVSDVTDAYGRTLAKATVPVGILLGDVDGNKTVDSKDVNAVSGKVGAKLSPNFRDDVNIDGSITQTDVDITQAQVGTSIP
jgi:hypothetical protein